VKGEEDGVGGGGVGGRAREEEGGGRGECEDGGVGGG